ncbi:ThiF family adenylyltransferase [Shinella sp. CPCC 101442]|uniref:HesA/MoeB/ThiF family protein n=1 Tax=Shinella sp. CPCC 101442 TaxID=2932265 RepID=UPI002152E448|nr:ThiF family adenylyltransferase [Shinella sp. CPCC 101442]MCR6502444.1 ThiF family adenylyltransferase [Shinella sp. CPCC 101442]
MNVFSYETFTTRNIGFVSEAEQRRLHEATVFICGTGGMGGAAIQALARAGVGRLILADIDRFELSNLNRQVFCFADTIGQPKAEATRDLCLKINPELDIAVLGPEWTEHAETLVADANVVINGADDLGASLLLYRTARRRGKTVIDAYASPLPSVYVTRPKEPMPEERLSYPTIGTPWNALTGEQRAEAFLREAEHVMVHSSSRHHVDLALAGEVVAGTRSRMSFAPMVISTGTLMAYEAINTLLARPHGADYRGWFFNPHAGRVERPRNALAAALLRPLVRRYLRRLAAPAKP